jgi:phosphoglycerate dehydrogenase-like enzyme
MDNARADSLIVILDGSELLDQAAIQKVLGPGFVAHTLPATAGLLREAQYLIVRDRDVDLPTLAAMARLRLVVKLDAGQGDIDEAAFRARGIAIAHAPSVTALSVAEHTVLLILALEKRLDQAMGMLRAGVVVGNANPPETRRPWYAYNWTGLQGFDVLHGKRGGLVGLGTIGRHVARLLRAFSVEVVYTKPNRLPESEEASLGVRFVPLDELLGMSDFISLHARYNPDTERLIGIRELALMKPGAYLVNTARGRLVDEAALAGALEAGRLAGAGLDVFWDEPLPGHSPLLRLNNVLLTPHVAGVPNAAQASYEYAEVTRLVSGYADS